MTTDPCSAGRPITLAAAITLAGVLLAVAFAMVRHVV